MQCDLAGHADPLRSGLNVTTTTAGGRRRSSSDGARARGTRSYDARVRDWRRAAECGREDLNLHPFRDQDLNLARLPVPPRPHDLATCVFILHREPPEGARSRFCKPFANHGSAMLNPRPARGEVAAALQGTPEDGLMIVEPGVDRGPLAIVASAVDAEHDQEVADRQDRAELD